MNGSRALVPGDGTGVFMQEVGVRSTKYGIEQHGIHNVNDVFWNLPTAALYEHVMRRREGLLCHEGPLAVTTGHHTGRSPNDKFIVREPSSEEKVWWGKVNRPFDPVKFDALYHRLLAYIQMKDLYIQDCFAGADPAHRVPIRVITGTAWHSLFARTMFLRPDEQETVDHVPEFTVIDVPQFHAVPSLDGTNSEAFIILNLGCRLAIIGGTSYAGEIKKTLFSVMNYLMPQANVLPMHCSANVGPDGDTAIFFGASSILRAGVTRKSSGFRPKPSPRSMPAHTASGRFWKTSSWTQGHGSLTSMTVP